MNLLKNSVCLALGAVALCATLPMERAVADPCGMVPPISVRPGAPIARIGDQNTYVFFKNGIETFVIRPGFSGKVDQFGMLIPLPSVPALRKVSDNVFPHIRAAIDPPEVLVDLRPKHRWALPTGSSMRGDSESADSKSGDRNGLQFKEVRVLKKEAVGMYEVAVLGAGSAEALKKWMDDHGYQYPKGMDKACLDYIKAGWCFVAVKTKVGTKDGAEPKPGMRKVNNRLPKGATFDGHVQAMGFRFRTKKLVVPMRLSTFNKGDLHNIVYVLSDSPKKIRSVPEEYVMRQISGKDLIRNTTGPLPLRILGGTLKDLQKMFPKKGDSKSGDSEGRGLKPRFIGQYDPRSLAARRNPVPHNGIARSLFASDLLSVNSKTLSHPHEEQEKMFLRIGEALALRGPAIDTLNEAALEAEREKIVMKSLKSIDGMTLSVIDGNFPREVLANQNLTFTSYKMASRRNTSQYYNARTKQPTRKQTGVLTFGTISHIDATPETIVSDNGSGHFWGTLLSAFSLTLVGFVLLRSRQRQQIVVALLAVGIVGSAIAPVANASNKTVSVAHIGTTHSVVVAADVLDLIDQLKDAKKADTAAAALVKLGQKAVPNLLDEAKDGTDLAMRGWAIVCLSKIGGKQVATALLAIQQDKAQEKLVRTWAIAGRVTMAKTTEELLDLANLIPDFPAIGRPIGIRLVVMLKTDANNVSAEDLLKVTLRVPKLQSALAPAILGAGPKSLAEAMRKAKDMNIRRQAAAYLATLANQGDKEVPGAVIAAYKFQANAKVTPWDGGPLFVPGLKWGKKDAQNLVRNLLAWYVWLEENADAKQKGALQAPIHNNLRSIALAGAAGYQGGWNNSDVYKWLLTWGKATSKAEVQQILDAQKVGKDLRYLKVLSQLK